ncbi:hypothetical protein J6590_054462 [Homalodisca vitripennis]|nr:hypothetical protein J6590_054462 [Homalodisca vitripennis]
MLTDTIQQHEEQPSLLQVKQGVPVVGDEHGSRFHVSSLQQHQIPEAALRGRWTEAKLNIRIESVPPAIAGLYVVIPDVFFFDTIYNLEDWK